MPCRREIRLHEKETLAIRAEALAVAARLNAVRARLNPHFLFIALHLAGGAGEVPPSHGGRRD